MFTKEKRSQVMAAIRSKRNASTEEVLARLLRRHKICGWRRHGPIAGRPDFVFPKKRLAIFVDGCFWHGCPKHGNTPKSNEGYWGPKLKRNMKRDRSNSRTLRQKGWRVLRVWEHALASPVRLLNRIRYLLDQTTGRKVSRSMSLTSRRLRSSKIHTPP
jgi:DNA mismatch endonuclease, patch repair protein